MPTTDIARQLEAEDLVRAKTLTQHVLQDWDFLTWNELLAEGVVLYLRIAPAGSDRIGDLNVAGDNLQVSGREDAKRVLRSIYEEIKRGLCVTSEILSGYDVALLGNLTLESTKEGGLSESWPIVIYAMVNSCGMISLMTIATVDLQPLTEAIRRAARTGTLKGA